MTADLTPFDWDLRAEVYACIRIYGEVPTVHTLRRRVRREAETVRQSLCRLEEHHQLALDPERKEVWMANPFSASPTAFPVETAEESYWAPCAWDALGIPAILGEDAWCLTHCADSGEELEFGVRNGKVDGDDCVIHLVAPPRNAWDDIGFT